MKSALRHITFALTLGCTLASSAWAQKAAMDHSAHSAAGHTMAAPANNSPSNAAYMAANTKMHKDMGATLTGDADRDFLLGMIPHHQGAIDMAEVVLKYGKDAKIKALATKIITAQKQEIADMQAMLKALPAAK